MGAADTREGGTEGSGTVNENKEAGKILTGGTAASPSLTVTQHGKSLCSPFNTGSVRHRVRH